MTTPATQDAPAPLPITEAERERHRAWLLALTALPTAAGREGRIERWVRAWAAERGGVRVDADAHGNLTLSIEAAPAGDGPPVYFTAHTDHPAFVVERIVSPTVLELVFRGGVMDDYFEDAAVVVYDEGDIPHRARLSERVGPQEPYKRFLAELRDTDASGAIAPGDVAVWDLPAPSIERSGHTEIVRTPRNDDLAAAAAALAALDRLRRARDEGEAVPDVRVLLTRAEEVGFIGAIGACRSESIPAGARLIALENSRASADAPIGGGPIVRVGDRISVFDPRLTGAVARRMEQIAGGPAHISAQQKAKDAPARPWQRKLMAGGACEATVFCAFGYSATCVCLPLGNYHNMGALDAVQAGAFQGTPPIAPEEVALADFEGMVDLLVACGQYLPIDGGTSDLVQKLWTERAGVLSER